MLSVEEGGGEADVEWREPEPSEDLKGSGGQALRDRLGDSHSALQEASCNEKSG